MTYLLDLLAMLAFRVRALRAMAGRKSTVAAWLLLGSGFLSFVIARNLVYSGLELQQGAGARGGLFTSFLQLNLIQALLFLAFAYVPALICLSNAFAGDGLGFSFSREEYQVHVSALFPLWGVLLFEAAALQILTARFFVLWIVEVSAALAALGALLVVYTVWVIKEINYISTAAALGVFVLSWFTLPLFFMLTIFLFALPLFLVIPLAYLVWVRLRGFFSARSGEADFQEHLRSLTMNPQDADAHHQLGLIHLKRRHLDAAQTYFENAVRIDPQDPDYHYYLGRVLEEKSDWIGALAQYEETYRLNATYGLGDIFREVGKAYLHTAQPEKAVEFLRFFLESRSSDPEGRYWLAVAHQRLGQIEDMRNQLRAVLEQGRSNPPFFRKENRRWLYQARALLRQS